jgi:hypothetical protein
MTRSLHSTTQLLGVFSITALILDLTRLSGLGIVLAEPGLGDAELAVVQGDAADLAPVIDDVAVRLLASLLGADGLSGTHEQDGLDGGTAHDVDRVIDGRLSVFDQGEQE